MLGWVSLFTDTASEMVYPLLPLFLTRVLSAGAMSLGVIEGVAEAASSVLKIISGRLSDRWGAPKPLVLAGYTISSAVRPFIAFVSSWIAGPRAALHRSPRQGHPRRAARRDAGDFADASNLRPRLRVPSRDGSRRRGVGPLIASAFLYFYPGEYRTLFALTIIPGIVVVLILLRVPDTRRAAAP